MTEIIIDGVDVKECKRRIGKNNYCRYFKRPCAENNYNCIWKKYLRKEQECKELREDKIYTDMACEQLEKENNQIKAENERLKTGLPIQVIGKDYFELRQEVENLKEYNDKLIVKTNELQTEIGKFRKVYSRVRTEAQGLRVSALSSLRNTERFETPKDRSIHTTRLARILHIATGIEKLLEEIEQ